MRNTSIDNTVLILYPNTIKNKKINSKYIGKNINTYLSVI